LTYVKKCFHYYYYSFVFNIIQKIICYYKSGKPNYNKIKLRKEEQIKIYPDTSKARKILKWKPKTNIHELIKEMIDFEKKLDHMIE
jgi:nucleoside-diphosphate-sugar epimerase